MLWFLAPHSALRSKVSFPRPHLGLLFDASYFNANRAKLAVTIFVRGVITQAVLRANLIGDACKSGPRILQTVGDEVSAAAIFCQTIHLFTRQVVEVTTNLHTFKLPHRAKVHKVFGLSARIKNSLVPLQLFRRQRQPAVVLTIAQQSILDKVFRVYLNKIRSYAGA